MSLPDDAESSAHFTARFESFTDVVFGFSLSFLASRLVVPEHAADIFSHPSGILGFLISFAFLAALWMLNHRTFRFYFAPTRADIVLVFIELCGVAVIPFALTILLRFSDERAGVSFYCIVYAWILASSALIGFRGFRRNWQKWSPEFRLLRWRTPLVQASVAFLLTVSSVLTLARVPYATFIFILVLPVAVYFRRFHRAVPSYARQTLSPAVGQSAES